MNIKKYTIVLASFLILSCNNKQETKSNKPHLAKTTTENDSILTEETPRKESINLFTVTYKDSSNVAFVSLSDIYPLNDNASDTLALPNIEKMGKQAAKSFTLEPKYRNRFLSKTNISENDSLFVYDYSKNKLASFAVKSLKATALLNGYSSEEDWPYPKYYYMIGFEINTQSLNGFSNYYADVLVYVGKENPFTKQQLTPMLWKKVSIKEYPSKSIKKEDLADLKNKPLGNTYAYKTDSFEYFLQEYLNNLKEVGSRRLIVIDSKTKKIIIEKMFIEGESLSAAPLNYQNGDNVAIQYTGKLFKNKPPVVFGFAYESFGCSAISLIDKSNEDIYIQCDNRH
ncbi:oxidoreductase [Flavobacterium psychroterrae]|uniref:Oxidoreductase n=1 Tax=Flavobacterium psychroterrae TaxID=2133767 RepID=A0ABS5PBM4_9FLAO|nr:oxidoreductase [Flavobacterium psychroterrae]MBS7231704.1 oxidoreductase [Flavobacterium psychroterrae]